MIRIWVFIPSATQTKRGTYRIQTVTRTRLTSCAGAQTSALPARALATIQDAASWLLRRVLQRAIPINLITKMPENRLLSKTAVHLAQKFGLCLNFWIQTTKTNQKRNRKWKDKVLSYRGRLLYKMAERTYFTCRLRIVIFSVLGDMVGLDRMRALWHSATQHCLTRTFCLHIVPRNLHWPPHTRLSQTPKIWPCPKVFQKTKCDLRVRCFPLLET